MVGAVFLAEVIRASRGRLAHYARWSYGAWLTFFLFANFATYLATLTLTGAAAGATANFAHDLVDSLVWQQTMIVLLAAPSFAAGAVTDEKIKGTLEPLFLAFLRPDSIILGKLLARVAQVFVWSLAAWPVIALVGVPGGVAPIFFVALSAVTLLMLMGMCAVSMLASVWARTTRGAVISVYVLIALAGIAVVYARKAGPRWAPIAALSPNYVLDTARDEPDYAVLGRRMVQTTMSWGVLAVVSTAVSIWRLRPAFIKQRQSRRRRGWVSRLSYRPAVSERPVEWKERYATRGLPRWAGLFLTGAVTVLACTTVAASAPTASSLVDEYFGLNAVAIFLCSLAAGVRASGCVAGERDKQTWESLLSTPLSFEILLGHKLDAIVRGVRSYYLAFLAPSCLVLSFVEGAVTVPWEWVIGGGLFVAALVTAVDYFEHPLTPLSQIGLALAASFHSPIGVISALFGPALAEVAIRFMAGIGAWFTVRVKSGWLSLLATVVVGYLVGVVVAGISTPLACASCCLLSLVFLGLGSLLSPGMGPAAGGYMMFLAWAIGCSLGVWWAGRVARNGAIAYLERTDRIPTATVRVIELDSALQPLTKGREKM